MTGDRSKQKIALHEKWEKMIFRLNQYKTRDRLLWKLLNCFEYNQPKLLPITIDWFL